MAQSRVGQKKGRELNIKKLPEKVQAEFAKARAKEWKTWLTHGVVEQVSKEEAERIEAEFGRSHLADALP